MFGKLIKNEFKSTFHTIGFIYVTVAVIIGLFEIAYHINNVNVGRIALALLMLTGVISVVVTFFMVIVQFNKSLYSNQGYLSFTLPVTSGQLLASKAIVACFWMIASWVVSIFAIAVVSIKLSTVIAESEFYGLSVKDILQMLANMMTEGEFDVKCLKSFGIIFAIFAFLVVIQLIAQLYFAVTLSNTRVMQKLGAFSIVLVFFAVFIVSTILLGYFMSKLPMGIQINLDGSLQFVKSLTVVEGEGALTVFPIGGLFFEVISGALLFVATSIIMDSKVNIK